jgi:hypothetical protein
MSGVALLADNDVLLRAAHWDLLEVVPVVAGAAWSEVAVLPSLLHRARRADPKLFGSAEVAQRLAPLLEVCAPLPTPRPELIGRLQQREDIDSGEQVLFASAATVGNACVLTGDKRAIRALLEIHRDQPIPELVGRVMCLEQFLWCALSELGVDDLLHRVRQFPELDRGTLAIMGRSGPKSRAEIEGGLISYMRDLDGMPPTLLSRDYGVLPRGAGSDS